MKQILVVMFLIVSTAFSQIQWIDNSSGADKRVWVTTDKPLPVSVISSDDAGASALSMKTIERTFAIADSSIEIDSFFNVLNVREMYVDCLGASSTTITARDGSTVLGIMSGDRSYIFDKLFLSTATITFKSTASTSIRITIRY